MKGNNFKPLKEIKEKEEINKSKDNENQNKIDELDKEINEKIEKEKQLLMQQEKEKAELNAIIKLLKLDKDKRVKTDIIKIKNGNI